MPGVIHFEINVDDLERAAAFYESVFGWKIERISAPVEYWLAYHAEDADTGNSIPGLRHGHRGEPVLHAAGRSRRRLIT